MKFRYYITDLNDGVIAGTDAIQVVLDYSLCEDYFVVDSHTGEWLQADGSRVPVKDISGKTED